MKRGKKLCAWCVHSTTAAGFCFISLESLKVLVLLNNVFSQLCFLTVEYFLNTSLHIKENFKSLQSKG